MYLQSTGMPSTPYHCWYFHGNETDNCIIENMYCVVPENNHTSPIELLFSKTPYITMEVPIKLHAFLFFFFCLWAHCSPRNCQSLLWGSVKIFLNLTHFAYLYYSSGQRNNKGYKAIGQCQEAFNKLHHNFKSPSYACGWGGYAYVSHVQHTEILHTLLIGKKTCYNML